MSGFYQSYLTDKSYILLTQLQKSLDCILIGGWAVYLYTQSLKSKDIDIIVDFSQLGVLQKEFPLKKNDRLKKYEVKIEEINIDIYVPFFSHIGVPVENCMHRVQKVEGFKVLLKELLLVTKLFAYKNRKGSVKGKKDAIDIISLLMCSHFDYKLLFDLLVEERKETYLLELINLITKTREVQELNINQHAFAKHKKEVLQKLQREK